MRLEIVVLALALGACRGRQPALAEGPKVSPAPRKAASGSIGTAAGLSLYGGKFLLPPGCKLECVLAVDAYHGTVRCSDLRVPIEYFGALTVVISRDLEPDSPRVQGRRDVGDALLYWGDAGSEYCAFATYPIQVNEASDASVNHQFCVGSQDVAPRARVQAILETFQRVPLDEPQTDCKFDR